MKQLYLWISALVLMTTGAHAQTKFDKAVTLSFDGGTFFPRRPGHNVAVSFPYVVSYYNSGTRKTETFDGALQNKFAGPLYLMGLKLGVVHKGHNFEFGGGFFRSGGADKGDYFKLGYGYIFYSGGLLVRPTLDMVLLRGKNKLGTMENTGRQIMLLGYTAYDQYTIKDDDGVEQTYNADHLDVNYRRYTFLFNPKIVVGPRLNGKFFFNIEVGWMLQSYQKTDIQLEQTTRNADATYTVGKMKLANNGSFNGPFAGLNVGVCF